MYLRRKHRFPFGRGGTNKTPDLTPMAGQCGLTLAKQLVFVDGNDSNAGTTANYGTKNKPFSTIESACDYIYNNYQADLKIDDVDTAIIVAPGHTESLTAASQIVMRSNGTVLIGIGTGTRRPTITSDAAVSGFQISANNLWIENIVFKASVATVTTGIAIDANRGNMVITKCEFIVDTAGTDEFIDCINLADNNNNVHIEDCKFDMQEGNDGAVTAIMLDADCDNVHIENCIIQGTYSFACILGDTTKSEELHIDNCLLQNGATDAINTEPLVELMTGTSGLLTDCYMMANVLVTTSLVGDTMVAYNNVYSETVGPGVGLATASGTTLTA